MTKKLIAFVVLILAVILVAEYFIAGRDIIDSSGSKPQSKEEFCKKYPRHISCFSDK